VEYELTETGGPVPILVCDECGRPIEEAVGARRVYVGREAHCLHNECFVRFVTKHPDSSNAGSLEAFLAALVVQTVYWQPKPFMQKLLYTAGYDHERSEELARQIVDELNSHQS
jgi:hypothetical protein